MLTAVFMSQKLKDLYLEADFWKEMGFALGKGN